MHVSANSPPELGRIQGYEFWAKNIQGILWWSMDEKRSIFNPNSHFYVLVQLFDVFCLDMVY